MPLETKQATVAKVKFRNDSGWTTLLMDDKTTWVGTFEELVQYGDTIQASGEKITHPKFGEQFSVLQTISVLPKGADGQIAWLASELPSIGPERAKVLVETFGERLWEVLSLNPPALAQIPGLSPEKAAVISAAYNACAASKEIVSKLVDLGLSVTDAKRIYKNFGKKTAEILTDDPYDFMEVAYITFDKADLVARRSGMEASDPRRACGYARHLLAEDARNGGHCYLDLQAALVALCVICPDAEVALRASKRFVVEGERLWLERTLAAEITIANWVMNKTKTTEST